MTLTQGDTLTHTDDNSTNKEDDELASGAEGLYECGYDDHHATNAHSDTTSKVVGNWTTEKEATNNSTDGVSSIHTTNGGITGVIEIGNPVFGAQN